MLFLATDALAPIAGGLIVFWSAVSTHQLALFLGIVQGSSSLPRRADGRPASRRSRPLFRFSCFASDADRNHFDRPSSPNRWSLDPKLLLLVTNVSLMPEVVEETKSLPFLVNAICPCAKAQGPRAKVMSPTTE